MFKYILTAAMLAGFFWVSTGRKHLEGAESAGYVQDQGAVYIDIRPGADRSSRHAYVVNNSNRMLNVVVGTWERGPDGDQRLPDRIFATMGPHESRFVG